MSVKRFKNTIRMSEDGPVDALVESDTGSWVLWSDYDALAAELADTIKRESDVRSRAFRAENRVQQLEAALSDLHAMVWGECPSLLNEDSGGSGDLDITIRDLLTPSETAAEQTMFKPLKDGLCIHCGRDARNHDFGGPCRPDSAMEDLAASKINV